MALFYLFFLFSNHHLKYAAVIVIMSGASNGSQIIDNKLSNIQSPLF